MAKWPIAMRRELTFYPENERTRDLIYSEQSSCDRSLHLLLQDNSGIPYEFLLKAYRTVVTRYLSSLSLRPPEAFLRGVVAQLEQEAMEAGIDVDDFRGAGFFLLLRSPDAVYLLTLNERDVCVFDGGEMIPPAGRGVEKLRIADEDFQKELFPHRLRDVFTLFRIDPGFARDRDIVVGCGEQAKGTVLEALSDPSWSGTDGTQKTVKSKFVSRRILAVRFGESAVDTAPVIESIGYPFGGDGGGTSGRRRNLVAAGAVAVVAVLAMVFWVGDRLFPGGETPASIGEMAVTEERRDGETGETPVDDVLNGAPMEAGVEETAGDATIKLSAAWKNTYEDQVTSSPVVSGNWVVFGCRDGNLYALDKSSGETLWKFAATGGIGASPAVYKNNVIAADYNGKVFAVDLPSGRQMWSRKLPMRVVSSPHASGDRVVVGCYDGYAYCLSAENGSVLWKRKTRDRIRGSSVAAGDTFVVPSYDGFLYGLESATGNIRWRVNLGGQLTGGVAVAAGTVVVGVPDGRVCAVAAGSGDTAWSFKTAGAVKSSPAIFSGKVYTGSNDGHVYCINMADGSLIWKYRTGDLVLARPFIHDGVVYAGSYDGNLYALEAADGTLLDKFDTGGAIYSSPTGDEDHLYFGNNRGDFICLSYHAKKSS